MDSIQIEQLTKELERLTGLESVLGSVLVNRNGLTITSRVPRTVNEKKMGALAATMFEAMESAIEELNEEIINITVEYDEYQLVVIGAKSQVILVAIIEYDIDLGITLIEAEETLNIIQDLIRDDKNVDK
ncbi:MAG: roadblock/LC7 domain-containing protein [Promethearchaeota archaeon]